MSRPRLTSGLALRTVSVVSVAAMFALSACTVEQEPPTSQQRPRAMDRFLASDGLYAVPQLMTQRPPANLADTAFWISARSLTSATRQRLAPDAVDVLRPLANAEPGIDALWAATLLRDHTGSDLAAPALVTAVRGLQRPDGFFAPADAPKERLDAAALVDYSYRAAQGLRGRASDTWLSALQAAAATVDPASLPTAYARMELAQLRAGLARAATTGHPVSATPPTTAAEAEHLFDLLAQVEDGGRLSPDRAADWVRWATSTRLTAAEYYVVAKALVEGGAPPHEVRSLAGRVAASSAAFARTDGTYHAYSETAGDVKASYFYLVTSQITSGSSWRDPGLAAAVERAGGAPSSGPFRQWDAFLRARVREMAGGSGRVTSIEIHPAWVKGLERNVRSLPENVVIAVDAGVVVPALWDPSATTDAGMLAHLYVANWLARAATPSVSSALLAEWRRRLQSPTPQTANRELFLVAAALLLADPRGDTDGVRRTVAGLEAPGGCEGLAFLARTARASRDCDIQASLARSIFQLVSRGETLEDALDA